MLNESDLRIDSYRPAVVNLKGMTMGSLRITHMPSGKCVNRKEVRLKDERRAKEEMLKELEEKVNQ